jgi:hypothetical protein
MLNKPTLKLASALVLACSAAISAQAQDAGALVDKLIKKGILTDQEGEEVRADMMRDFSQTNAGKINLSSSVTELKLYGDFRYRYQFDDKQAQVANPAHENQRSKHRIRLRLGADFTLGENFYAGVSLQTGQASDSGNQVLQDGFDDYNIFLARAFVGWRNDWLDVTLGKFRNPFYTTDLIWDPDIEPQGLIEQIAFHKMPFFGGSAGPSGKESKEYSPTEVRSVPPWELTLVAGQLLYDDNDEFNADNDASTDAYIFVEQLIGTYRFNKDTSVTLAPAFYTYTAADLAGFTNENAFSDAGAFGTLPAVSGETRQLHIITAPGDVSFKMGGIKSKLYWDFAYNFGGRERFDDILQMAGRFGASAGSRGYRNKDSFAWLVGFQLGETKKKGDWQIFLNYRESGIASIDPNLNDSDFALSELNSRGFKLSMAYAITDFVVLDVKGFLTWNLDNDLFGGRATSGASGIGDSNSVNTIQVDLSVKF